MKTMSVRVYFTREVLAAKPADPEIYSRFIASKAPDAETREQEIADIGAEEYEDRGKTIFMRTKDRVPYLEAYAWKGFFKEKCYACRSLSDKKSKNLRNYRKKIDLYIFVYPDKIPFIKADGELLRLEELGECQRPLRASTPKGEMVSLACSETAPADVIQEFEVRIMDDSMVPYVVEWLAYGEVHGTGQWRNSGKGRFYFEAVCDGKHYSNLPKEMRG